MAVWRHNIVLMLICVTLYNVGYGRIIKAINEGTTATTPYNTETTFSAEKSTLSKYEIIKEKINVSKNETVSEDTSWLMNNITSSTTQEQMNGTTSTMTSDLMTEMTNTTTSELMHENCTQFINRIINENTTGLINEMCNDNLSTPINRTELPPDEAVDDFSGVKLVDLAFVMDTTGSMSSYIESARKNIRSLVDEIVVNSNIDLRVALIEYRDHPPQETSFVTRTNDFRKSVKKMRKWLKKADAKGGGDNPEAVAEGLFEVTQLSWRPKAAKIAVLISDAPPHGLAPWEDNTFKEGSPEGNDPIQILHELAKREIIVYSVGCEPSIIPYKDFFMALAYISGGQYIPLSDPIGLIQAIIGGTREELSLLKFSKEVEQEINKITSSGAVLDEESLAKSVYEKLNRQGARSDQLLRNNKPLEGASEMAKVFAASTSMADVRMAFEREFMPTYERMPPYEHMSAYEHMPAYEHMLAYEHMPDYEHVPAYEHMAAYEHMPDYEHVPAYDVMGLSGLVPKYEARSYTESDPVKSDPFEDLPSSRRRSETGESYTTVNSAISYEQIARLVRKKVAKSKMLYL